MEILPITALNDDGTPKYSLEKSFPLLAYSKQAYLRSCVDEVIENVLDYRVLYETDNASDLKELVLQGLGISWLPKLLVEKEIIENKLKIVDCEKYKFNAARHRFGRATNATAARRFRDFLPIKSSAAKP